MRIRLERHVYQSAQRLADCAGMTFSAWVAAALARHADAECQLPCESAPKLTRADSVAAGIPASHLPPNRIRACIAIAILEELARPWPYKYDRATLQATIQIEQFWGRPCDLGQAERIIERKIEQRRAELAGKRRKRKVAP